MLKPLNSVRETISLIAKVSDTSPQMVHSRLLSEAAEIGSNVHRFMREQQIPMYQVSEALDAFYRESDAFLYETTVWNCCKTKQKMRDFVSDRMQQLGMEKAEVFCFGDGLGFDSTHLAQRGHRAKYFEPSLRCQDFAQKVFHVNEVEVTKLAGLDDIQPNSLDAVVCLDVLEHVQNPELLVKAFHRWLKKDGLLFVHSPFWCIHWTRCTHLKENRRHSGGLKKLYTAQGFSALDAAIFWNPIVFQKTDSSSFRKRSAGSYSRIALGRLLLTPARIYAGFHTAITRRVARVPNQWADELKKWTSVDV